MPDDHRTPGRRRWRQLAEIERLLALGCEERAGGLVVEHLAQFPDDAPAIGTMLALFGPAGPRQGPEGADGLG